jgi:hypothetical protein
MFVPDHSSEQYVCASALHDPASGQVDAFVDGVVVGRVDCVEFVGVSGADSVGLELVEIGGLESLGVGRVVLTGLDVVDSC